MPSKTFINLSNEKRNLLLKAAYNEFSRVLYDQASINKIIKEANIPRGSFYMYFTNKEDLYSYLLEQTEKEFFEKIHIFIKNNNDLITAFINIYDYIIDYSMNEKNKKFIKNVFLNIHFKDDYSDMKKVSHHNFIDIVKDIDISNINIDESLLLELFKMLLTLTIHNVVKVVKDPKLLEEKRIAYINQLNIIKYGIYKR